MNVKRIKQGARINYYNGIYIILLGIFYTCFIGVNMKYNFNSTKELWGFFTMFSPGVTKLFYLFNILIGLFLVSTGITIMHLSDFIGKRKEKLTWLILCLSGTISWAGLFIISILFKNWILIFFSFFGTIMFFKGIL